VHALPALSRGLGAAVGGYALALLVGLLALWVSDAFTAGFSGADEPAHFLNSWFIASYAREAFGQDPMAFATEFYLHYPKISIGHWPPAYYGLLSPFFLLLPARAETAFALNLFISALPAAAVAAMLWRFAGRKAALAGALLWAITPLAVEGQAFFMLDQPLSACAAFGVLVWTRYAERPTWPRILLFAGLAALAILIKGNGWLLVLMPAFHILLTRRWDLLARAKTWIGAVAGAAFVAPWYIATAGIAADGFNYKAGPVYAAQAFLANLVYLADNLTLLAFALAGLAVAAEHRGRIETPRRWSLAAGCTSLVLATLVLQSLVPVDITDRYLAPALPGLVVLAVLGMIEISRRLPHAGADAVTAGLAAILVLPGVAHLATRKPKVDFRLEEAAQMASGQAWLIDGTSGAEGAFVAAMAVRDPALERYTIRGSKLLAESDFMGRAYRLKFDQPAQTTTELRRLGISGVVLVLRKGLQPFPHTRLLRRGLEDPASGYRIAAILPHRNRTGVTEIYAATAPMSSNVAAIRALGIPGKAIALVRVDPKP
jgi:hypothetical protein